MAKSLLIDTSKCTACRGCQVACKQWNDLDSKKTRNRGTYQNPPTLSANTWKLVTFHEISVGDNMKWLFLAKQCFHCTDASCVSVCPTKAAQHHGEFVLIDEKWCIGCGYCVQACPYDVPHSIPGIGRHKGSARKCTFCVDRISNGLEPACKKTCPAGAVYFGEREEMITSGRKKVSALKNNGAPNACLYGENELGGLHVLYVLTERPAAYNLPEAPRLATTNVFGQWISGVVTAGIVAVLPFWFLFKRRQELKEEKETSKGGQEK